MQKIVVVNENNFEIFCNSFDNKYFDNYNKNQPFSNCLMLCINEPVAYIVYDYIYDRFEIVYIFVKEIYRKKGYGSTLLEHVIELGNKYNIVNITLEVNTNNTPAINLYKKYGFEKISIRKNYYLSEDGILMKKEMM